MRTVCSVFLFILSSSVLFSLTSAPKADLDLLDKYLDKADLVQTQSEWTEVSGSGEEAVLTKYESELLTLTDAGIDRPSLNQAARAELDSVVRSRLSAWLMDRFFSGLKTIDYASLLNDVEKSKIAGIFELDANGNIKTDEKGAPVRKALASDDAFKSELGTWKTSLQGIQNVLVADWESTSTTSFDELLDGMNSTQRQALEKKGQTRLAELKQTQMRQIDAVLCLEESDYQYLRLRDQYSLRLKSDGSGAASVVDSLITKIGASLDTGLKNLDAGLKIDTGEISVDGKLTDGADWQAQFRSELNKGLDLWKQAGEDFLVRRIEWERQAGKDLVTGMEAWDDALRTLQEKQRDWLGNFQAIRERGETQFEQKFTGLEAAREQALAELDQNELANQGNLSERVSVTVGMLNQSLEMMKTARESVGYWLPKTAGNESFKIDSISWNPADMRKELLSGMVTSVAGSLENQNLFTVPSVSGLALDAFESKINKKSTDYFSMMLKGSGLAAFLSATLANASTMTFDNYLALVSEYVSAGIDATVTDWCTDAFAGTSFTAADRVSLRDQVVLTMHQAIQKAVQSSFSSDSKNGGAFNQAFYWTETIYFSYAKSAEDLNEEITQTYGLLVFNKEDVPAAGYANNSAVMGPIEALNSYGWEDIYLDSYQVELLQARAVQGYWEKEVDVAQAVYEYSKNGSYTRQTEATTTLQYGNTLTDYQTALKDYQQAVADLGTVDTALAANKDRIAEIRNRLEAKKAELNKAKTEYSDLLVMAELNSTDYYAGQYKAYYEQLLSMRGLLRNDTSKGTVADASEAMTNAAASYTSERFLSESSGALSSLIHGDPLSETHAVGIAELRSRLDARRNFTVKLGGDECKTVAGFEDYIKKDLGLSAGDAWYTILVDSYKNDYAANADSAKLTSLLKTVASTLSAETSGTLERRMMDIRLLLAPDASAAYASVRDIVPGNNTESTIQNTVELLKNSQKTAETRLLADRLDTELAALDSLSSALSAYTDSHTVNNVKTADGFHADAPAQFGDSVASLAWNLDRILQAKGITGNSLAAYIESVRSSLRALDTVLTNQNVPNRDSALHALAAGNSVVEQYLNGGPLFSDGTVDYTLPSIADSYAGCVALSGAATEYATYSKLSVGLQSTLRSEALSSFGIWLDANNLGTLNGNTLTLTDPVSLWNAFKPKDINEVIQKIVALKKSAETVVASDGMPDAFRQGVSDWLSEVSSLFMIRGMNQMKLDSLGDGTIENYKQTATDLAARATADSNIVRDFLDGNKTTETRSLALLKLSETGETISASFLDSARAALGASLAAYRTGLAPDSGSSWDDQYNAWFAGLGLSDAQNTRRETCRAGIIAAAETVWEKSLVAANPTGYDYSASTNKKELSVLALSAALKSCTPEQYLAQFGQSKSTVCNTALALYQIQSYIKTAGGDANAVLDVQAVWTAISFGGNASDMNAYLDAHGSEYSIQNTVYQLLFGLETGGNAPLTLKEASAGFPSFAASVFSRDGLLSLAGNGSSSAQLYGNLYCASLYTGLSGQPDSVRNGVLALLKDATGIGLNAELNLAAFAVNTDRERAMQANMLDDQALLLALKSRILSGESVSVYLAQSDAGVKTEAEKFQSIVNTVNGYSSVLDGDFTSYLETCADLDASMKLQAQALHAQGAFDDPVFFSAVTSAKASIDRQRGLNTGTINALSAYLAAGFATREGRLSDKSNEASFSYATALEFNTLASNANGSYRKYLGNDAFLLDVANGEKWDTAGLKFTKSIQVDNLVAETSGSLVYSDNARVNDGLESAARLRELGKTLTDLFAAWTGSDASATVQSYLSTYGHLSAIDILSASANTASLEGFTAHEMDYGASSDYETARDTVSSLRAQESSISSAMNKNGATVTKFVSGKNQNTIQLTAEAKAKVDALEKEVNGIETEWDSGINFAVANLSPAQYAQAGYKQLESEYRTVYARAQTAFENLDRAKQAHKIAKAVYDYAATPYLKVNVSVSGDGTDEAAQLLSSLASIDPDTRLQDVNDHLRRASASVDALESLYGNASTQKSLYERDATYAKLKDSFVQQYRYAIASRQARQLLDVQIRKAQDELADAEDNYKTAVTAASNVSAYVVTGTVDTAEMIKKLNPYQLSVIKQLLITNGKIGFSGTGSTFNQNDIQAYFAKPKDGELSQYEKDLAAWMTTNPSTNLATCLNALSWEEFSAAGGVTYDQYTKTHPLGTMPGLGGEHNTDSITVPESEYHRLAGYGTAMRAILKKTVLSGYNGNESDDDLNRAIREVAATDIKNSIDVLNYQYQAVKNSGEYAFFKMASLLDTVTLDDGYTSQGALDSCCAYTFFEIARSRCQSTGSANWPWNSEWHSARDSAAAQRNKALDICTHESQGLVSAQTAIVSAKALLDEKKANLKILTGVDPDTKVGSASIQTVCDALLFASRGSLANPVADILKTAGFDPSVSVADGLKKILLSSGTLMTDASKDTGTLLGTMVAELQDKYAKSDTAMQTYLTAEKAGSQNEGIAKTQAASELQYKNAYAAYVAGGILPASMISTVKIAQWETILQADLADPAAGITNIIGAVQEYLETIKDTKPDDLAIRNVQKAYAAYRTADKAGHDDAIAALGTSFTALTVAYHAGADYASALKNAIDNPVFNEREDSLRTYECFQGVMNDLQSEKSGLKTVGLDSVTQALEQSLLAMNQNRMNALKTVRTGQWDILMQELTNEKTFFDQQMNAILSRGMLEWKTTNRKLTTMMEAWKKEYQQNFQRKEGAWDERYLAFLESKNEWAKNLTAQAVNIGDKQILDQIPTQTEDYIAQANDFIISDVIAKPDTDSLMRDILDKNMLSGLLGGVSTITQGIDNFTPIIFQSLKHDSCTTGDTLDRVRKYQTSEDSELQARLAFIQYDKALETLKKAKKEVESSVDDANKTTWNGFRKMLVWDGFTEQGGNFVKDTIVGATLFSTLYDEHVIKGYQSLKTDVRDFTKDFAMPANIKVEALGFDGIQALLQKAMSVVPEEYARIFGKKDNEGATCIEQSMKTEKYNEWFTRFDSTTKKEESVVVERSREIPSTDTVTRDTYDAYVKQLKTLSDGDKGAREQFGRMEITGNGIFNDWVGYAPVMKSDADPDESIENYQMNVRFAGAGETGRILGMFMQHKLIEASGKAACNQPKYSMKLWDDRGSWMPAPSIRSVADIAVTVAVGALVPGGHLLLAAAMNMMDDAVFTVMDVSNGMNAGAAWGSFGKKSLASLAVSEIGAGFNGVAQTVNGISTPVGGLVNWNSGIIGNNLIGKSLLNGTEIMTSNIASSSINAVDFQAMAAGKDFFDQKGFTNGAFGNNAMAGVMAGMAGTYVNGKMANWNLTTNAGNVLTGATNSVNVNAIQAFNNTMGGLASTAVTYGMTGNASVNILNTSMFGMKSSTGLFELGFGKNGVHGSIGTGGTDMNLGMLNQSFAGYGESQKVNSFKTGSESDQTAIEFIAMADHTTSKENAELARKLYNRETNINLTDGIATNGEHYNGEYSSNSPDKILLNKTLLGDKTLEDYAKVAAVLSHEGSHMGGDTIESDAYQKGEKTYLQAALSLGLKVDGSFVKEIAGAMDDPKNQVSNGGGEQLWRVLKNGDIKDDNKDDQVSFEDGRETKVYKGSGKQATLEAFLGLKRGDGYSLLMKDAKFGDYKNGKWTGAGNTIKASAIQVLVDKGILSTKYNNPELVKKQLEDQAKQKASEEASRKAWEASHQDVFSKFDKNNPQVNDLIKQYDKALSSRPAISTGGCVFRDIQAVCEIAAGKTLTSQQIIDIWDKAIDTKLISSGGSVQSAAAYSSIAELTLKKLQLTGIGVEFGSNDHNGRLVGYIGVMPYSKTDTHKAFYLTTEVGRDPFYNPGHTKTAVYTNLWKPVHLYSMK